MKLILGFDPGGDKKFGWCIATDFESHLKILKSGTDNNAFNAVSAVITSIKTIETKIEVLAAGIDSPLFWIANGDREVDKFVRKAIAKKGGNTSTVMSVNSLKGACLIQGII